MLNTNLYNGPNNLTWGEEDPCGQLSWFEQQLQLAQSKNIKVGNPVDIFIIFKWNVHLCCVLLGDSCSPHSTGFF